MTTPRPKVKRVNILTLVLDVDPEARSEDIEVYNFSNDRKFTEPQNKQYPSGNE